MIRSLVPEFLGLRMVIGLRKNGATMARIPTQGIFRPGS